LGANGVQDMLQKRKSGSICAMAIARIRHEHLQQLNRTIFFSVGEF